MITAAAVAARIRAGHHLTPADRGALRDGLFDEQIAAFLADPLVCHESREWADPEDWAPPCGAWASDHCVECGLCPGLHAEDCEMGSDIRCSTCGERFPWHKPDCGTSLRGAW